MKSCVLKIDQKNLKQSLFTQNLSIHISKKIKEVRHVDQKVLHVFSLPSMNSMKMMIGMFMVSPIKVSTNRKFVLLFSLHVFHVKKLYTSNKTQIKYREKVNGGKEKKEEAEWLNCLLVHSGCIDILQVNGDICLNTLVIPHCALLYLSLCRRLKKCFVRKSVCFNANWKMFFFSRYERRLEESTVFSFLLE